MSSISLFSISIVVWFCICLLFPLSFSRQTRVCPRKQMPIKTLPVLVLSLSGPAYPVAARPMSAFVSLHILRAISLHVSLLTDVCFFIVSGFILRSDSFISSVYATMDALKYSDAPSIFVKA